MKKRVAAVIVALILAACAGVAMRALADGGPIYSVPQIDAALRRDPASLVGRVVRVRGIVGFCPVRAGCPPNVPPVLNARLGTPSLDPPLQLDYGPDTMLLSTLRGLPVLGALVPQRPPLEDGYQGILRVRIEPVPPGLCFEHLCFEGVLQDRAQPASAE